MPGKLIRRPTFLNVYKNTMEIRWKCFLKHGQKHGQEKDIEVGA